MSAPASNAFSIIVRGLELRAKASLKARAKSNDRSMEAEARAVLTREVLGSASADERWKDPVLRVNISAETWKRLSELASLGGRTVAEEAERIIAEATERVDTLRIMRQCAEAVGFEVDFPVPPRTGEFRSVSF